MGPPLTCVADDDVTSNMGEENLSSPKNVSADAFDKKAGATKVPSAEKKMLPLLKSPP